MDNNEGVKRNAIEQKERSKKGKTIKFFNNKIALLFFKLFCQDSGVLDLSISAFISIGYLDEEKIFFFPFKEKNSKKMTRMMRLPSNLLPPCFSVYLNMWCFLTVR